MKYKYLHQRGALNEAGTAPGARPRSETAEGARLLARPIPRAVVDLVPGSVARENLVMPVALDGDRVTFAAVRADDIGLADKLRFILNKDVRLVAAPHDAVLGAILRSYGRGETESVDSMLAEFTDTAVSGTPAYAAAGSAALGAGPRDAPPPRGVALRLLRQKLPGRDGPRGPHGLDATPPMGGSGVFFYTVEEGQRVLMRRPDGTMEVLVGPRRVCAGPAAFRPDGPLRRPPRRVPDRPLPRRPAGAPPRARQGLARPARPPGGHARGRPAARRQGGGRRLQPGRRARRRRRDASSYGPGLFVPSPGEWLHTFSWHGSRGGHKGVAEGAQRARVPEAVADARPDVPRRRRRAHRRRRGADRPADDLLRAGRHRARCSTPPTTPSATSSTPPPPTWSTSSAGTTSSRSSGTRGSSTTWRPTAS